MEHVPLPLRRIIAEYAAEYEFVDFDPPFKNFMPFDALRKRPDFMKLLRENPGRVIHGAFHDVDHGISAGNDRWIVEPREDHEWSVLPELPSLEHIRQISEYSICIYATVSGYELLEKNPASIKWQQTNLIKDEDDGSYEIDLLILSDRNDPSVVDVHQIIGLFNWVKLDIFSKKYAARFTPVVTDDIKRALFISETIHVPSDVF